MTLGDMADFVCAKVRQRDTTSRARCKQFIRQRYEMLWNDELWKDSLFRLEFSFDMDPAAEQADLPFANFFSRDAGIWHLPPTVDRILALRRTEQGVGVADNFRFYRETIDAFAETGAPVAFTTEGPAFADLRGKLAEVQAASGITVRFVDGAADSQATARMVYLDMDGEEQVLDIAQATIGSLDDIIPQVILSVTKPTSQSAFEISLAGDVIFTLSASQTAGKRYPRIQLLPMPTVTTDFKALVKRKPPVLSDDNDELALRGADNCVMEYAQADMLEYGRQYSKAQAKRADADRLLVDFKKLEVVQEANHCQIVPEVSEVSGTVGYHHSKGYI